MPGPGVSTGDNESPSLNDAREAVLSPAPRPRAGQLAFRRQGARGPDARCPGGLPPHAGWPRLLRLARSNHAPHPQALRHPGRPSPGWRPARAGPDVELEARERRPPSPPRIEAIAKRGLRARAVSFTPPGSSRTRRPRGDDARCDPRRRRAAADHPPGPRRRRRGAGPGEPPRRRTPPPRSSGWRALIPPADPETPAPGRASTRCARTSTPTPPTSTATATASTPSSTSTPRTRSKVADAITLERLAAAEARTLPRGHVDDAELLRRSPRASPSCARPRASSGQGSMPSSTSPASTTRSSTCAAARARTSRSRATPSGVLATARATWRGSSTCRHYTVRLLPARSRRRWRSPSEHASRP